MGEGGKRSRGLRFSDEDYATLSKEANEAGASSVDGFIMDLLQRHKKNIQLTNFRRHLDSRFDHLDEEIAQIRQQMK